MRGDLVENVRKIQSYGIQVQAGMIVGFDNDDASIFEEQLRFIQDARIPVSMTGMLQAMPKTPLHDRMAKEGRLVGGVGRRPVRVLEHPAAEHEPDRALQGLPGADRRALRVPSVPRARDRLPLGKGAEATQELAIGRGDLRLLGRILWRTVVRASPRRAWFTLSLLATTLLRRPSVFVDAVAFAVVHQALYDYVHVLRRHLDRAIAELESVEGAAAALPG